jgi:hypothetical protein
MSTWVDYFYSTSYYYERLMGLLYIILLRKANGGRSIYLLVVEDHCDDLINAVAYICNISDDGDEEEGP